MKLLIGWCIRGVLIAAIVAAVMAWLIWVGSSKDRDARIDYLTAFWWSWGVLSAGVVTWFISDYLIDHDEWIGP